MKSSTLPPIPSGSDINPFSLANLSLNKSMPAAKENSRKMSESGKVCNNKTTTNSLSRTARLATIMGDLPSGASSQASFASDSSNKKKDNKESIIDLIGKKKEMFLVQVSILCWLLHKLLCYFLWSKLPYYIT